MGLTAGIVGLPNVGKSTLFNAITKKNILAANYPFATIDPNVGVVVVPDKRLAKLEEMVLPENVVPTSFEFIDIAGLVKGASKGEGLGNKFLSHIREVDAICEVVRCFDDENITHVEGNTDPIRDIEIINLELIFSDLEVINSRIGRIEKKAISTKDKEALFEVQLMKKVKDALEKNIPARRLEYTEDEEKILKSFNLLTKKPLIYVTNVSEEDINTGNIYVDKVKEYASKENSEVIIVSAKMESELSELNEEDKEIFLEELGINESGLNKLINATYSLLGLATYFTAGPKEVKAWTFKKGMKAPACAGIIHSDFEKGFIKAEVISFSDYVLYNGEKGAKENGKVRLEGKEYEMQDGDICLFRFNV
ncbi:MAG: redox-regulated ATPase YchF [Bacilli bacterium]|nr:redox-regulated ATPase YchF [Bacilli bacterium]MBP3635573.1 redox-regulated ATPase YchF [Bacilli bacterium]